MPKTEIIIPASTSNLGASFDTCGLALSLYLRLEVEPRASGFEIIPTDHVVFKSFYLLDKPVGRLAIAPAMEGIVRDDRLVCCYVANDLGGAWARDDFGNYDFPCEPGGEKQRQLAFRMGVNLVMYALCLDYKSDQVHVPFIMKRRRWKPDE